MYKVGDKVRAISKSTICRKTGEIGEVVAVLFDKRYNVKFPSSSTTYESDDSIELYIEPLTAAEDIKAGDTVVLDGDKVRRKVEPKVMFVNVYDDEIGYSQETIAAAKAYANGYSLAILKITVDGDKVSAEIVE